MVAPLSRGEQGRAGLILDLLTGGLCIRLALRPPLGLNHPLEAGSPKGRSLIQFPPEVK
jgi:hypothetical protein